MWGGKIIMYKSLIGFFFYSVECKESKRKLGLN